MNDAIANKINFLKAWVFWDRELKKIPYLNIFQMSKILKIPVSYIRWGIKNLEIPVDVGFWKGEHWIIDHEVALDYALSRHRHDQAVYLTEITKKFTKMY